MKKEKSCGAVIYKFEEDEIFVLLLKHNLGHWSFAKGHVEAGETEVETAKREVKEEVGLDIEIDDSFRIMVSYNPYPDVLKDVIYFPATATSSKIVVQEEEIALAKWVNLSDAFNMITYDNDKKVLEMVVKYLKEKYKEKKMILEN